MIPSIERLITKGRFGSVLDRFLSIVTHGWFDYDSESVYKMALTFGTKKSQGINSLIKSQSSNTVTKGKTIIDKF